MDRSTITNIIRENHIGVIRLLFTDILGRLKGININESELDRALNDGIAFDGSSVEGFVRIEESDLILQPDLSTFRPFPFQSGGVGSAMIICDIMTSDGKPFHSDPRLVLKRALAKAAKLGYDHFYVGPELEFFYFPNDRNPEPQDSVGYFDIIPLDNSTDARKATLAILKDMGMKMEASHHEVARGQHEIDFRYGDALLMADQIMVSKMIIKEVARRNGLYASFMPKPIQGENGSGMHVHQSLFKGATNAFYSKTDPYNLSKVGRAYTAGLLAECENLTAITNQWVNSYKRLVPGYEAPAYISWGRRNRSTLIRVPAFSPTKPNSCRVEYRAPDPGANPYLAFALMLQSGLAGIEKNLKLAAPVEEDIFEMTPARLDELGIRSLPGDLRHATEIASKSSLVKEALGAELFEKFIANKLAEWDKYRIQVTDYELKTYLPVL